MIRTSSACSAALLLVACCGCASSPKVVMDETRRRPDGIAVDPLEYPPEAQEAAPASAGVVALRTPLAPESARQTLQDFLMALGREDLETLRKLISPDATSINPATRARENTFYFFSRRFGRLDYFSMSNVSFWQDERMELYRAAEAGVLWSDTVGPTANPSSGSPASMNDALEGTDVVVRLPISPPRTPTGEPLMGDELTVLLRRSGGRYVIHRLVEEFTLPN